MLFPKVQGAWIVAVLVPLLSLAAAYLATLIVPTAGFWTQLLLGLAATFVRELITQLQKKMSSATG